MTTPITPEYLESNGFQKLLSRKVWVNDKIGVSQTKDGKWELLEKEPNLPNYKVSGKIIEFVNEIKL